MVSKPTLVIVSPALAAANNGNWRTASRWARFLGDRFHVDVRPGWSPAESRPRCMIALHARRSAGALETFAEACPNHGRILVLTGTDLYGDLAVDAWARRSLDLATHLVVLQDAAPAELEARHRRKCRVIYQSAPARSPRASNARTFDVIFVGHMRPEKDPMTPMRAVLRLPTRSTVRLTCIGEALDAAYA